MHCYSSSKLFVWFYRIVKCIRTGSKFHEKLTRTTYVNYLFIIAQNILLLSDFRSTKTIQGATHVTRQRTQQGNMTSSIDNDDEAVTTRNYRHAQCIIATIGGSVCSSAPT